MAKVAKVVLTLAGTAGDETLTSTAAVEVLSGGEGFDTLRFEEGTKGINVNLKTGKAWDAFGNRETVSGFEVVFGTDKDDRITGSDSADILVGGGGNDRLVGNAGNDEIYGGTGDDVISGGAGSDYMVGGQGNDRIHGGQGYDYVDYWDEGGAFGVEVNLGKSYAIDTYGTRDTLHSIERVRGTDLGDSITGNGSNNLLDAGGGDDILDGGNGDDVLWGGFGVDVIKGGNGNDTIVGGRGNDTIIGGRGTDTLDYGSENGWRSVSVHLGTGFAEDTWGDLDTLSLKKNETVENVIGTALGDWIHGSALANVLTGGAGDDTLTGGGGKDTFVFATGHGNDRINDFSLDDTLDLRGTGLVDLQAVLDGAVGVDLGVELHTGDGTITLVDVNITSLATLNYLFA
jgi:Ca2+-binding RTX toxin-like protein